MTKHRHSAIPNPQSLIPNSQPGFTLVEVLVTIAILSLLAVGIFSLIILSLRVTADNQSYVEAIEIANQKIEQIRNMPYDDIGVVSGSPAGNIPQVETISRGGNFTVNTYITFYDDPYDGEAGSGDTIITDYKIVTIKVSWQGKYEPGNVTVFSKIIPRTEETAAGYGLLKISVTNANAEPLPNASVRVVNNSLIPAVDVTNITGANGILYLAALESFQSYEITVTKTDEEWMGTYYGTDQTYDLAAGKPPTHLSVTESNKTEENFTIDKLATLQIRTVQNGLPNNWRVSQPESARDMTDPNFSIDSADNMYFTWENYTATSSYVHAQKYNSTAGKQWANDYKIGGTNFQKNPDIAAAANGNSFIVWQDNSVTLKQITYNGANKNAFANNALNASPAPSLFSAIQGRQETTATPADSLWGVYLKNKIIKIAKQIKSYFSSSKKLLAKFFHEKFMVEPAKAAGTIVQTKIGSPENGANSLTATFDSPPEEGNVIIAIAVNSNDYSSFSPPYNSSGSFTESAYSNTSWYLDIGIWHKVAGAGEPSQVTIDNSGDIDGGVLMLMEVSGLDTSDLIDVISTNDQTGSSGLTATTGTTAQSEASGFAVAAFAFADNNFNTPNSGNYSSGSSDSWTHRLWRDWWEGYDGSLAVATLNITSAAAQSGSLTLAGGGSEQRNSIIVVFREEPPDAALVSSTGSQSAYIIIPDTDQYMGGAFTISDTIGNHNVTGITISEYGTVDAQNNLSNIKLFYDFDTAAPYDCADEQYDAGIDAQFGTAASFDAADGSAAFTDVKEISTVKTLCIYTVLDVESGAGKDETVEIKISNPSTDVTLSSDEVSPATAVEISGATLLLKPAELNQMHYRWRNDDGSEAGASWNQYEDAAGSAKAGDNIRLRFEISNEGSFVSDTAEFRIEYGIKPTVCSDILSWTALPADGSQHWQIIDSSNLTDEEATTNIYGLTDENDNFIAGAAKDANNQALGFALEADEFTELEFSIAATANAGDNNYCFRLTDAGSTGGFNYTVYPEAAIIGDENIYIISLDADGNERWAAAKRVNSDSGSADQENPRIAITSDSATTTVVWRDGRNGNDDIYAQSFDTDGNKLWANDLQVSSAATDDLSPALAFDSNGNIIIAWVNDGATNKNIYAQKFDLDGNNIWAGEITIANQSYDEYSPAITADNAGNFYLSWTEDNSGVLNVKIAKYDSTGAGQWSGQPNLGGASADQYDSALATDNTYLYISWTDNRDSGLDIYAQKYDLSYNAQWAADQKISISLTGGSQLNSALAINGSNENFSCWQDNRDGDYNIYATEFFDPSSLTDAGNVPLRLYGSKTISETPVIYEFDQTFTTDASGEADFSLEWDSGYTIEIDGASVYEIKYLDPVAPLGILPDETKVWTVYVE